MRNAADEAGVTQDRRLNRKRMSDLKLTGEPDAVKVACPVRGGRFCAVSRRY